MPAACTTDDMTKSATCMADIGTTPTDMTDLKAMCDYAQKSASCYPKCYCDDATTKAAFDESAKMLKEMADCTVTCGAAGLRATVLTGILAAFVAIFAAK